MIRNSNPIIVEIGTPHTRLPYGRVPKAIIRITLVGHVLEEIIVNLRLFCLVKDHQLLGVVVPKVMPSSLPLEPI